MNRPLIVVLGAVTFALMSVIFFWVFKLTMANSMKTDMVSPEKVAAFIQALLEANRNNYTDNVVVKLQKEGIQAHEHWKDERGVALPAAWTVLPTWGGTRSTENTDAVAPEARTRSGSCPPVSVAASSQKIPRSSRDFPSRR